MLYRLSQVRVPDVHLTVITIQVASPPRIRRMDIRLSTFLLGNPLRSREVVRWMATQTQVLKVESIQVSGVARRVIRIGNNRSAFVQYVIPSSFNHAGLFKPLLWDKRPFIPINQ